MPIIVEKDEDGFYVVECPLLKGCYTQGKSLDEALKKQRTNTNCYELLRTPVDFVIRKIGWIALQIPNMVVNHFFCNCSITSGFEKVYYTVI